MLFLTLYLRYFSFSLLEPSFPLEHCLPFASIHLCISLVNMLDIGATAVGTKDKHLCPRGAHLPLPSLTDSALFGSPLAARLTLFLVSPPARMSVL